MIPFPTVLAKHEAFTKIYEVVVATMECILYYTSVLECVNYRKTIMQAAVSLQEKPPAFNYFPPMKNQEKLAVHGEHDSHSNLRTCAENLSETNNPQRVIKT